MSSQDSMFYPPEQQQQRPEQSPEQGYPEQSYQYTPDARELSHQAQVPQEQEQQPYQEAVSYEDGYRGGYDQAAYGQRLQGEKLQPRRSAPSFSSSQILLFVLIIVLVAAVSGLLGSIIGAIFSALSSLLGLALAVLIIVVVVSTKAVPLPPRSFTVGEQPSLLIHNHAGSIRIHRGTASRVEVQATKYIRKYGNEQLKSREASIECLQDGDRINITTRRGPEWGFALGDIGRIDLDITVPEFCEVRGDTNMGTVRIAGINGRVNLKTNAGTINVEQAVLVNGSALSTSAGTIDVRQATLSDGVSLETSAGTIHAEQTLLKGQVSLKTSAGTVHFDGSLDPRGDYRFRTSAGTIHLILPATSSFVLAASTNMGSVNNEFGSNVVGYEPRARLDLHTDMGSIHVARR